MLNGEVCKKKTNENLLIELNDSEVSNHITIIQDHPLLHKSWLLYMLFPFRFFGFAFFKDSFDLKNSYDSEIARIDFDVLAQKETSEIMLALRYESSKGKSNSNFFSFHVLKNKNVKIQNVKLNNHDKTVEVRWKAVRIIPIILMLLLLIITGLIRKKVGIFGVVFIYLIISIFHIRKILTGKSTR